MINGEELVRYFSEVEDDYYFGENLYSDYEIDNLIDAAYEAGYREAMFSDDDTAALAGAAGAAALAGGVGAAARYARHQGGDYGSLQKRITELEGQKANKNKKLSAEKVSALEDKISKLKDRREAWEDLDSFRGKFADKARDFKNWARKNWAGVNGLSGDLQEEYLEKLANLKAAKATEYDGTKNFKRGKKDLVKNAERDIKNFLREHKEGLSKGSGRAKLLGLGAGVLGTGAAAGYGLNQL